MSDDNTLPKPITMTGTAFDNVEDELDSLEAQDSTDNSDQKQSDDPNDLPVPVVFGDDEDDEDEAADPSPAPKPTSTSQTDEADMSSDQPKDDLEAKILEDINANFDQKKDPLKIKPSDTADLPADPVKPVNPVIPSVKPVTPSLANDQIVSNKEPVKPPTQTTTPLATPVGSPTKPDPAPVLDSDDTDNTKLPDQALASINQKANAITSDFSSNPDSDLDLDQDTQSAKLDSTQSTDSAPASNQNLMTNPFIQDADSATPTSSVSVSSSDIKPDKTIEEAKKAVAQIATLNDQPQTPATSKAGMPKVLLAVLSLFVGSGLVIGGYFAAQSIFGSKASVPIQAPMENQPETVVPTPVATPIIEEEAPLPASPSATPKAIDDTQQTSDDTQKESQYTHVLIDETPTGWLNARSSATTKQDNLIQKVYPGDIFPYLGANDTGWFKLELEDGVEAWISGKYATKLTPTQYQEISDQNSSQEDQVEPEEELDELED